MKMKIIKLIKLLLNLLEEDKQDNIKHEIFNDVNKFNLNVN